MVLVAVHPLTKGLHWGFATMCLSTSTSVSLGFVARVASGMCLKSVAVTGTALLFNNTLSVLLELAFCPTVTIFLGNCTVKTPLP